MNYIASAVFIVEPNSFCANPETLSTNAFQMTDGSQGEVQKLALTEFKNFHKTLHELGIEVHCFQEPPDALTPDALFPNNWFAVIPGGKLFIFPMYAENRRREVQIPWLRKIYPKATFEDLRQSPLANSENFLEGTGSLIFDHFHKIVFACESPRTSKKLVEELCHKAGYTPFVFQAVDENEKAYYHTNVIMALGEKTAVICLESLGPAASLLNEKLHSIGKKVIPISRAQVRKMAGNILRLKNNNGEKFWLGSTSALMAFTPEQLQTLEAEARFVAVPVPTIEKYGGGSVRCMLAELFYPEQRP